MLKHIFAALALLLCAGCGSVNDAKTIVVYSPHGKFLEGDVKQRFEAAHPGWTVQFLDMGGGEIFDRVKAEKSAPRAGVWWGGTAGDFKRAEKLGLLEPYVPDFAAALPAHARSKTGGWVATFVTPEIILYNPKKIPAADLPRDWNDLLDSRWKGRIVVRDARASSTMKTIFGALILREKVRTGSVAAGFDWLKKLDANTGTYAPNPDGLNDLLRDDGPYALSPWNLADALESQHVRKFPFEYIVPPATMIPVEPIALVKGGPSPDGAKLFYDFVNSPEQLVLFAQQRDRIPARTDIPKDKLPAWMGTLTLNAMDIDWDDFDANIEEWMARWDAEIKGKGGR
jgi:iron(III) transport system substrate-binding protein